MEYKTFYNRLSQITDHDWLVQKDPGTCFLNVYYRKGSHLLLAFYIQTNDPFVLISSLENRSKIKHFNFSRKVYALCCLLASTPIDERGQLSK